MAFVILGFCQRVLQTALAWRTQQNLSNPLTTPQSSTCMVKRDNRLITVPIEHVVVGDILQLREGMALQVDARLISAEDLRVDEAALTGESILVHKMH